MSRAVCFLKNIFSFRSPRLACDPAAARELFRKRYQHFRSLLTANNNALELMAEMEETLRAGRPFSMAFVRGHVTALTVNVFKMAQHLQAMADDRYVTLLPAFERISARLEGILERQPVVSGTALALPMGEVDRGFSDQVGEKMAQLGEVGNRVGLPVPDGFMITAAAYRRFMEASHLQAEINRRLKTLDQDNLEELYTVSAAIQQLIATAPVPPELEQEIKAQYQALALRAGRRVLVAVRSSALGEDAGNVSFAGQYRTQLDVDEELLLQIYKEIVASKFRSQAIVYRRQRGFRHQDVIMCVGCLAMVEAAVSGVVYSRSPSDPRSSWIEIAAAAGFAAAVVDGSAAADLFRVDREPPHAIIDRKLQQPERGGRPASTLTPEQAADLARAAIRLESHFGAPQDIEWSMEASGRIVILQSRSLSLAAASSPGGTPGPGVSKDLLAAGGITASRGVAAGVAYYVRSTVDLLQFPPGAVLVVGTPRPEYAALLPRAVAVISESGQAAAHLATVAREFGVPAIFGLDGALERIAEGQEITVDATACRVYAGRREELLALASRPPNLMAGSPVYKMLEAMLHHITPLNLTDPGSPFFRPSSCETLHDLTRFCHEKALTEMFALGDRLGLERLAAKQLAGETPYNWWVIDLDNGLRPGFDPASRFVFLQDIVSAPMLAIWEGMTAVPWPGPPPVDLKGFGSILFRSSMNPGLEPAVRSSLTARNYFLISDKFCNLSVRLGYHFALVEAHLGELLTENYLNFQFKGGAADPTRRSLRVQLLGEVLSRHGFRIEQRLDALTARIEKKPAPLLRSRLKILGYLLIHTRQIDMVMADAQMMAHYQQRIAADLELILKGNEEEANDETFEAADRG